jgi:predicted nucleic acid-binding protein
MIIDTTYLLPLAKVGVDADLLLAIAEKKVNLRFDEIGVSLISLFELQAKAAKLRIPTEAVNNSTKAILETFTIIPFSDSVVVDLSFRLRQRMKDYIDCVIIGTAAARREDLVSEDSKIWRARKSLREDYGINVRRYKDLVKSPPNHL